MLAWSQIKPLIREVFCPPLCAVGFSSPGVKMWRTRDHFIDAIGFRVPRAQTLQLVFGCQPRHASPAQQEPWYCVFSTQPGEGLGVDLELVSFAPDEITQRERLARRAEPVQRAASLWFAQLATVESARRALETNEREGVRQVFIGSRGSASYLAALAALDALDSPRPIEP